MAPTPVAAKPSVAEWIGQSYPVPERVEVMAAPSDSSVIASRLRAGTTVEVIGVLSDPRWLEVSLPDKSTGFVLATSLPGVFAASAPQAAAPTAAVPTVGSPSVDPAPVQPGLLPIRGLAYVHDSATLLVLAEDGAAEPVKVPLSELDGFTGDPKLGLAHYLESNGAEVACDPAPAGGYVCKIGDGTDIARAALVNGVARTRPAAAHDYEVQQQAAIAARRGIWRNGEAAVASVPFAALDTGRSGPGDYVPGVEYVAGPVPESFAAAAPADGLAFIDDQPFTLDESLPAPVVYEAGIGWGFWDRSMKWRQAPDRWASRLDLRHPRGDGLRPVDLDRHGFVPHDPYFHGPALAAPGQAPAAVGRGPYVPASFATHLPPGIISRPGSGFVVPGRGEPFASRGLPPPGAFERGAMTGSFQRGGVPEPFRGAPAEPFQRGVMPQPFQHGGPAPFGQERRAELARPLPSGLPQHEAPFAARGFQPQPGTMSAPRTPPPVMAFSRPAPLVMRSAPAFAAPAVQRSAPPVMVQRMASPVMMQRAAPAMVAARSVAMPAARPAAPPPRPPPPARTH